MKTTLRRYLLTALIAAGTTIVHAQNSMVPSAMSYQGLLTDAQGDPVAPTTPENRNVEFRIYDVAAGGTPLWGEAQTVTVFKGNFSVILGNGTAVGAPSGPEAFASVFTNATSADLYFGITPQGDPEFAPRQKLLSSAFALRSKTAESVNATAQANGVPSQFNWLSANNLAVNGHTKITGNNALEFGVGVPNKETNAGRMGYKLFTQGLDIIGAGETNADRKITLWAEGGTEFKGPITIPTFGQLITLHDGNNGIGVQNDGPYFRAAENFSWFRQGTHNQNAKKPGTGGTRLALLNSSGFTLESGKFTGDGSGLTNINPGSLPNTYNYLGINGTNVIEFGKGVANKEAHAGQIGYGTYTAALDIVGAGNLSDASDRKITLHAQGGLGIVGNTTGTGSITANGMNVSGGSLSFGNRLGQLINLWGNTFGIGIQDNTLYSRSSHGFSWFVGGSHDNGQGQPGGGVKIAHWTNEQCDFYKSVNISGVLDVSGERAGTYTVTNYAFTAHGDRYNNVFIPDVSIQASKRILAAEFDAYSDVRLKLPTGRSDSAMDLQTLADLEVTDYTMKDRTVSPGKKYKKLIAQQVEKVYPLAVSSNTGVVPDIYQFATAKNGFIHLPDAQALKLVVGQTVRLALKKTDSDVMTEVTEVNAQGFAVKEAVDGDLFVYGRQVNDLRTLDYEAIGMLNVSATQELARQFKAQATALEEMRKERDALSAEVTALRNSTTRQDQRLAQIEAKLAAIAAVPAATTAVQVQFARE